jgi:hypothetical protein
MLVAATTLLAGALALAPALESTPAPAPAASEPQEFRAARVEIVGFDESAVLAALRLRMPRLPIERHGSPLPHDPPHVYVQIARAGDTEGTLRVITSDGRAFERSFAIEIGQEVRVAASTAASLLFAVEQGAVAPDREDVAIPAAATAEPPVAAPEPVPEPTPPPPEPVADSPGPKEPAPKPMPEQPADRWTVTTALHGAALLALPPQLYADALTGGGGGLGVELRAPRGATAALDLRGIGSSHHSTGVGRLRIAVGGGYTLRRGRFELPVIVALSIEPWWVTSGGGGVTLYDGTAATSRRPLIGGYLRLTPAARLVVGRERPVALRFGPRLELGGSFVVDGGAKIVGLADKEGDPRFRLGGLELSLGLELAIQLPAFRARSAPR